MGSFISTPISKQKSLGVKVANDVCSHLTVVAQLIRNLSEKKCKKAFTTNYKS